MTEEAAQQPIRITGNRYQYGGKYYFDPAVVEELAFKLHSVQQIAQALGVSDNTIQRRLQDDPDFIAAYDRGLAKLRKQVAEDLIRHSGKNVIASLALANQPHIFGFVNGTQRTEGRIEHVLTLSPAQAAFIELRAKGKLDVSQKDTVSQTETMLITDAETIEK